MELREFKNTAVNAARQAASDLSHAHIGSDVWLARIFLLVVLGIGCVSLIAGVSPGKIKLCPCPLYFFTHVKCPGCGMTHACIALARGDIRAAWNYNPFAFELILLAVGLALFPKQMHRGWQWLSQPGRNAIIWTMLILVLGFWIRRLL